MLKAIKKIFKVGTVTKEVGVIDNSSFESYGDSCKKIIAANFNGSLAIRHLDAGSCNGCELEIHALNNAFYDIERFGIHFVASPRHADLLLVTGPVSLNMKVALIETYNAMPNPKVVLAVGDCLSKKSIFKCSYACVSDVENIIPIAGLIKGCPPKPIDLLKGILTTVTGPSACCQQSSTDKYNDKG